MHFICSSWESDSVLLLSKSLLLLIHGRNRRFDVEAGSGLAPPLVLALLMLIVLLLLLLMLLTLLVSEFLLFPYTATRPSFSARSSSCFRSRTSSYVAASKLFWLSRIVGRGAMFVLGFSLNETALSMSERVFASTSSTFT
jgi:hypothetical protein